MMIDSPEESPITGYTPSTPEAGIAFTISMLLLMVLLATLLTAGFAFGLGAVLDIDIQAMFSQLDVNSSYQDRSIMRLAQGVSHLLTFCVAAMAALWLIFRWFKLPMPHQPDVYTQGILPYLNLRYAPKIMHVLAAAAILLAATPIVQYLYLINKAMNFPEWMHVMESQATEAIKGFLRMDNPSELLVNLFVVALLPAVGEELIFRGIVQPQMYRLFRNGWVSIIITGFIFSAIHMQFEGFIARWFLGILLGWLYLVTNNLWVPIAAHFFNNGLQVVVYYMHQKGYTSLNLDDDIETTTVQVGNDSNNVVAIPTADSSGKCSSIVESATSKKEEIPQLLDPAPTVSEKKVRMVAPTRDKEKVAKLAKSSRKSPPSSKKFVSSPVLEECYNENNGTSLLERMKNITSATRMDNTKKDTVEPTKNDATVNHQPSLSSIGIANPKKSSFSWSKADNSPVEMMAKFTSRTKIDDCSLSKEEQTLLKTELLGLAVSKSQGVSEDDVKDNAPTSKDISLDSHEGNGILDHLSITSASRESNDILDHLRMSSADGNSIEKIDYADHVNDLDRLVTQERTRLSNLLEESVEKSNEDEDEKFEVDSKCKVELKRSTENSKELTHKTKVITPCSDNEAEVEMILGGSSLAHGAGQESNASTSSSLKSLEKLLALALASADKPEDVARFLLEHHTQKANSTSMPVSPPTTEVYVSPSKKERSLWSPFNLFSEDQGLESAASSVTHHSYPNNKTSNNEVCSVETEPKNSSDVCNNNTSLKNNYSFISADFNMNEHGSNKGGYEIKQKDETDSIKRDQEKIDALKEVLTNMSSDMKLREELLTWVANTEDDTFSWHSVETDNEDGAFGGDGNVDEEILNEDNANNTLLLNRAKKESIVSKHRSRILSKIRENKAKNKETSFEGDKSSTINTPIFSPTTPDEEVSLLSYKRASVTSLWDDSASLTVTEESSTGSAESVAACGLGVMQEMTKDLGEVLASIKQMLPGCISRG